MGKVGDKYKELKALLKLMTYAGKCRIGILAIECFLLIIIAGFVFEFMSITYFICAVIGTILYVILITLRALGILK